MNDWKALKADTHRKFGRYTIGALLKGSVTSRTFRVIATMRFCKMVSNSNAAVRVLLPFTKLLHVFSSSIACVDFPWNTSIDEGIALTHGWGTVLSPGAKIGKNVTIFHGVTLGRRDRISKNGERTIAHPTIEDEVWIGPNATIVGGVTIGRGSRIAGGSFITESVPPFSTVAGNPSKIVKENCMPDVMNPAP